MLAVLQKVQGGYTARFERHFKHSVEKVWSSLTENDKLSKWFSELKVDDLREGGTILFDMQNGTFEELKILELKAYSVLEYTWGNDRVRFELYPESDGCKLVLIEKIDEFTEHTSKDLAGWHVCLNVVNALLDEKIIESRESEWKAWYGQYIELLRNFNVNQTE